MTYHGGEEPDKNGKIGKTKRANGWAPSRVVEQIEQLLD
jgi:hypothetical protein